MYYYMAWNKLKLQELEGLSPITFQISLLPTFSSVQLMTLMTLMGSHFICAE